MIGFIIWVLLGIAFIALGVYVSCSKKAAAFGFWANAKTFPVEDIKGYNRALGKLWCFYGAILVLLGIPLLAGQNSPYAILSILGILVVTIAVMVIYTLKIEGKYRQKDSSSVKK